MINLRNFKNIFSVPELRRKIAFTLGVLIVYRIGSYIPVIGVDVNKLHDFMQQSTKLSGLLSYLDVFSGGALAQCTLFALSVGPYITASIFMQIMGHTIPELEQLLKEGDYGRRLVNQYTRYLALGLSILYASGYAALLESNGLVIESGWMFRFVFVLSLSVGCMSVIWLGEQIQLFGIGGGSSMIIFAGIVGRLPDNVIRTIHAVQTSRLDTVVAVLIWLFLIAIIACIILLERGDRKIPVQYARRVIGNRVYGGQNTYIPFKINNAGVLPAIFTSSFLGMFVGLITFLSKWFKSLNYIVDKLVWTGPLYNILQLILIVFFYFLYTAFSFDPVEIADNIKKSGGFVPGLRPGKKTAEFFDHILTRLGLVGAVYLGVLAILPNIMSASLAMPFMISGTSLLIMVGVALDTSAQVESHLIEHNYEGFLSVGKLKKRGSSS